MRSFLTCNIKSDRKYVPLLILTLILTLWGCGRNSYQKCGGMVWNTVYNVTFEGPANLADSIMPVLDNIAASASAFDSLSLVSRINRNETDRPDDTLIKLYETSLRINRESDGKFDPTVGPLIQAWGFGKGHSPSADTLRINEIIKYVGIDKCTLSSGRLTKPDPRMQFNFSAIAKGLGCDAVAEMLERNGVTSYLIEIGGEIRASGCSPRGDDWAVSIDAPIAAADSVIHKSMMVIDINKGYINNTAGVATSGNYRNFHSENGKSFGHTIDPQTGRPAVTDVASATVVAPTTMEADAYATAIMAMGSAAAVKMCRRLGLSACIVTCEGKIIQTSDFKIMTR